jgi:hypothetical protein
MVKYKISKKLSQAYSNRCEAKHNPCWNHNTYSIKIITNLNCSCCQNGHRQITYLCEDHIKNMSRYLNKELLINLPATRLEDPIQNNLFVKI